MPIGTVMRVAVIGAIEGLSRKECAGAVLRTQGNAMAGDRPRKNVVSVRLYVNPSCEAPLPRHGEVHAKTRRRKVAVAVIETHVSQEHLVAKIPTLQPGLASASSGTTLGRGTRSGYRDASFSFPEGRVLITGSGRGTGTTRWPPEPSVQPLSARESRLSMRSTPAVRTDSA